MLAVLGFHGFHDYLPGGFVGVDVFFVISGYLITHIIAGELRRGSFSFATFYARRIRRLFPSLVLVLAACVGLGWFILLPHEFRLLGKHVTAAALFSANIAFWREAGYFDIGAAFKPLLHLWSLGVEEQFYLVWPALLVVLWKRRTLLLITVPALVLVSLALSIGFAQVAPNPGFYSPFSRFWELGIGCLLALSNELREHESPDPSAGPLAQRVFADTAPAIGLILIAIALLTFDSSTPFPGWLALLPTIGTALILAAPEDGWIQRRVLSSPVLVYIGLMSYSLYLWHWPILSFANILQPGQPPPLTRWILLLSSFVLAALTYQFVELPIRRRKRFRINAALISGATVACLSGLVVYATGGFPDRFDIDLRALRHGPRTDTLCRTQIGSNEKINYCRATSAEPASILVLGDSKALAIYEAIAPLFSPRHSVMLLGRGGCPPLLGVSIRGYDPNERDCPEIWQTFVSHVQHTRPRLVVLVGNGSFLITDPKIELTRIGAGSMESKDQIFAEGLASLMAALTRSSHVIHLGEIPDFQTSPSCLLRPIQLPSTRCAPTREREQVDAVMAKYNEVLAQLQRTLPIVTFVNVVDLLCTPDHCSQWPADAPLLYSDEIHLSPTGARLLVQRSKLRQTIALQLPAPVR